MPSLKHLDLRENKIDEASCQSLALTFESVDLVVLLDTTEGSYFIFPMFP
jgi:hypothetical protein